MFDSFMYKVSLVCWNQLVDSDDAASELEEMEQEPAGDSKRGCGQ
jgi:hypothetical protein